MESVQMTRRNHMSVNAGDVTYIFGDNGFISDVILELDENEKVNLAGKDFSSVSISLPGKGALTPFIPSDIKPRRSRFQEAELIEFDSILWKDSKGRAVPGMRLALRYEFWPCGTAFVNAFFNVESSSACDMKEFAVKTSLALEKFSELRWGCLRRPATTDGALIQLQAPERFLKRGENRSADKEIIPLMNFNVCSANGHAAYVEMFFEGQNSIAETKDDNSTQLKWDRKGNATIAWNFIGSETCVNRRERPWQWCNQWGWIIKGADKVRRKPPFHMYHYLDNYQRYPTPKAVDRIADSGADVIIIHENWRFNIQEGSVPYKPELFKKFVDRAHKRGLRVCTYVRGNEQPSMLESTAEWFERLLKKNYDGLYMDYGGPFHEILPSNEVYPGGRIFFRRHFLSLRSIRERVGKDGLFFSHTGPFFSGLGLTGGNMDGYVSGEGEGGVMVNSRLEHEYFSMASVCTGTMWTAAFPAYSTPKMLPFLAAAGQYPHSPLGTQFLSSSLSHPQEPGLNDAAFRPVWKLWRFFRNERDIRIFNDYNSSGVFSGSDADTGHYLMISKDSKKALLTVSNFSGKARSVSCAVDWKKASFDIKKMKAAWILSPRQDSPGKAVKASPSAKNFSFELEPYGVAGVVFDISAAALEKEIKDFNMPYLPPSADNRKHIAYVSEQKKLRYGSAPAKEIYIKIAVRDIPLNYEYSLFYDLYLNSMELGEFDSKGNFKRIGWISADGLVKNEPKPEKYIWPCHSSPWIPLHKTLKKGSHELGVRSIHFGKPFYSFIDVVLSDKPADGAPGAKTLYFLNELEPDRSFVRWKSEIK